MQDPRRTNPGSQSRTARAVCQRAIPFDVSPRALPGVRPLDPDAWLSVDDAFGGQMALRDDLVARHRADVLQCLPSAHDAAAELLQTVLDHLRHHPGLGYSVGATAVTRPDGITVAVSKDDPLATLGRLVQEDLCILQKRDTEHVLTGAILCFPASWRLEDKFDRPMTAIHDPVPDYDGPMARRVQRLFDGVQVGRPLWRFNRLWYVDPDLHQPRSADNPRPKPDGTSPAYFRCEKQSLLRLPQTRAVIFAIHTYVVSEEAAPKAAFAR